MPGYVGGDSSDHLLYDHQPYKLNEDDYQRVCQIPKRKVCLLHFHFIIVVNLLS